MFTQLKKPASDVEVGEFDLHVGQWIYFSTDKDLSMLNKPLQHIFHKDRLFLVLTRQDYYDEKCRCYLVDNEGTIYDYCPRVLSLTFKLNSIDYNVMIPNIYTIPADTITTYLEKSQITKIYQAGQNLLDRMRNHYFEFTSSKKLDVKALLASLEVLSTRKISELESKQPEDKNSASSITTSLPEKTEFHSKKALAEEVNNGWKAIREKTNNIKKQINDYKSGPCLWGGSLLLPVMKEGHISLVGQEKEYNETPEGVLTIKQIKEQEESINKNMASLEKDLESIEKKQTLLNSWQDGLPSKEIDTNKDSSSPRGLCR